MSNIRYEGNNSFSMSTTSTNSVGNQYTITCMSPSVTTTYGGVNLSSQFIGWEKQIENLEMIGERMIKNSGNFPPYNVIKEDDDTFLIEFAVAGFSKKDIEVKQEKNALIIEASIKEDDSKEYIYKGIAARSFTRAFALAEYVEVKSATFEDGILTIKLIRYLPKEEQPKVIDIK